MLVDSHCHLNLLDLNEFDNQLETVIETAQMQGVKHLLTVCVDLEDFPKLISIANKYNNIYISLGLHPCNSANLEPDAPYLTKLALSHPSCIAIGETGLDYYRGELDTPYATQKQRFREHIRTAINTNKPLIIHTRSAAEDTLNIMREEGAEKIGGVMHCFTEAWEIAQRAIDMNFYISLSGIVTFKNATVLHELAKKIPLERLLIETDAPYLAPVPFRGKQNHPALVKYVALAISDLRNEDYDIIAQQTTKNFFNCFKLN